jgi:hypothetical protein
LEKYPSIETYARVYTVTGSDFARESVDNVMYNWTYAQFLDLETHVLFQDDRKMWAERQQEVNQARADSLAGPRG